MPTLTPSTQTTSEFDPNRRSAMPTLTPSTQTAIELKSPRSPIGKSSIQWEHRGSFHSRAATCTSRQTYNSLLDSCASDLATRASQVEFDMVPGERSDIIPAERIEQEQHRSLATSLMQDGIHSEINFDLASERSQEVHGYLPSSYSTPLPSTRMDRTSGPCRRLSVGSHNTSPDLNDSLKQVVRDVLRTELRTLKDDLRHMFTEILSDDLLKSKSATHVEYAVTSKRVEARKSFVSNREISSDEDRREALFEAVSNNDIDAVLGMLDMGADPNAVLPVYKRHNESSRIYTDCSLLAVAVMTNSVELVRLLVDKGADLASSRYTFLAGILRMTWSGGAIFAALPAGNLDMVRELVEMKANPHEVSSNNANLVWQSCYFGHAHILSYLLQLDVEIDIAGRSQDFEGIFHTPLHIAAIQDHQVALQKLIDAKAELDNVNEESKTPLMYAVQLGRISAIRILVAGGANLFNNNYKVKRHHGRPVDQLFTMSNPVLVKAAALGLQEREDQMKNCSIEDLLQFLSCSISKSEILRAVFKRRTLRYWSAEGTMEVTTAAMRKPLLLHGGLRCRFLNIATSRETYLHMEAMVKKRLDILDRLPHAKRFISDIAPSELRAMGFFAYRYYSMAAIATYEALVPDFHEDLRVLEAISGASAYDEVYNGEPCQAILQHAWKEVWYICIWRSCMDFLFMVVCGGLALHMSDVDRCWLPVRKCSSYDIYGEVQTMAFFGIPPWVSQHAVEILVFCAHRKYKFVSKYRLSWHAVAMHLCDGFVLFSLIATRAEIMDNFTFRVVFAILCVLKWVVVVYRLTPIRAFGLPLMPILFTLSDIGPFAIIFASCILAFSTGYIALDFGEVDEPWIAILMNVFLFGSFGEPDFLPDYRLFEDTFSLRVLFVLSTFVTCITMMNCFVAAMTTSYRIGNANQHRLYQRRLAREVYKLKAVQRSKRRLLLHFCCKCSRLKPEEVGIKKYLWYASSIEE